MKYSLFILFLFRKDVPEGGFKRVNLFSKAFLLQFLLTMNRLVEVKQKS